LFARLTGAGGQVWMTGTEPSLFAGVGDATRLHVEAGRIVRV
jgi:DNA replication and repair protein RecF